MQLHRRLEAHSPSEQRQTTSYEPTAGRTVTAADDEIRCISPTRSGSARSVSAICAAAALACASAAWICIGDGMCFCNMSAITVLLSVQVCLVLVMHVRMSQL